MNSSFWIFSGLFLFGLAVRAAYESLKRSGAVDPKSKVLFSLVFTAMCLMWASWFNMAPLDPLPVTLPAILRWTGLGLVIAGLVLAVTGLVQLRGMENIDHLVTGGLFARIRHPVYTGFILWIAGWALYHGALASLLIGLVGIGNILYWQRLEEADLRSRYGADYLEYRSRTWF
jgi:protein-S-isoprenylcysteine O-methyltransferase Ste14